MARLFSAFVFSAGIDRALGHAYMSWPASRNFDKCDLFDPHSLNGHCEDCNQDSCGQFGATDFSTIAHPVSDTYIAGGILDVEVIVKAHHKGYMEMRLCTNPDDLTQDCFNEHLLIRDSVTEAEDPAPVDGAHPGRWYIPPPDANWPASSDAQPGSNSCGRAKTGKRYLWKVRIPADVECEHCVLQWFWVTANSCQPVGLAEYYERSSTQNWIEAKFGGSVQPWFASGLDSCSAAVSDPKTNGNGAEKFWNCGDIRITKCSGDHCHGTTATTTTTNAETTTTVTGTTITDAASATTAALDTTVTTTVLSGAKCHAITNQATDAWCTVNCNHVPAFCPPDFCRCHNRRLRGH